MDGLGRAFVPVVANRYYHMLPADVELWAAWVATGEYLPDEVWYDVKVGSGPDLGGDDPEYIVRYSASCWRKRIDVVGRRGLDYWIIEVKPRAGAMALGQALFYSDLFEREFAVAGDVVPVIVTDVVDKDVLPAMERAGVVVCEVGEIGAGDVT